MPRKSCGSLSRGDMGVPSPVFKNIDKLTCLAVTKAYCLLRLRDGGGRPIGSRPAEAGRADCESDSHHVFPSPSLVVSRHVLLKERNLEERIA
jgi:hypothetical protein